MRTARPQRGGERARAIACALALSAASIASGCGSPPPEAQRETAPSGPVAATPEREGDAVVARVAGLPVYASCVEHQAAAMQAKAPAATAGLDEPALRRRALEECVGFELLAQEAAARGLGAAPEVAEAQRQAAVNRFVEREIDDKVRTAAELPAPFWARVLDRYRWRMHRVDYRASMFVRFTVPAKEPQGSPADLAAQAAAERVAKELADERGLFPQHVAEAARRLAPGQPMEEGNAPLSDADRLVPVYSKALFALQEIGRVTPAIRTEWGWDVVLLTDRLPPRDITEAQLGEELFPEVRLGYFTAWSKSQGKGISVQVSPQAEAALARAADEDATATGEPSTPPTSQLSSQPSSAPSSPASPAPPSGDRRP